LNVAPYAERMTLAAGPLQKIDGPPDALPLTGVSITCEPGHVRVSVTVITEQVTQGSPLRVAIAPLAANTTASPTPTFALMGVNLSGTDTRALGVRYQLDTWQGPWRSASAVGAGLFTATAPPLQPGVHILYAYATDSQVATSTNRGSSSGPLVGGISGYLFVVAPPIATARPSLSIGNVTVAEGNTGARLASFPVTLSAASTKVVKVHYDTANASAVAPGDYPTRNGTLTFAPGQVRATVAVPVRGDTVPEGDETFTVRLSAPVDAVIGNGTGVGTILNDD